MNPIAECAAQTLLHHPHPALRLSELLQLVAERVDRGLDPGRLRTLLEEHPETPTDKKIQTDVTKFVSERLGKDHYSTRKELTDKGGRRLFNNQSQTHEDVALEDLFVQTSTKEDT